MATKQHTDPLSKTKDLFADVIERSLEIMQDLTLATAAASMDASIASARRLVKLQRGGVKTGLGLVSKVQKYTEKSLHKAVKDGDWLPKEGKEVVDDWSKMMKSGLDDFTQVTDKSFELLLHFLDRVEKEQKAKASKASANSGAPKTAAPGAPKAPAKRKPAAKKKSASTKKSS